MVAPSLNDFEYQFKDTGVRLNALANTLPLFDITEVDGLDLPDVRSDIQSRDGAHGSFVYAKYLDRRTIILAGTLYAAIGSVEAQLDLLKQNFIPTSTNQFFYFKHPGISQRYILGKAERCRYKTSAEDRRIGSVDFELTIECEDPRMYIDNSPATGSATTGSGTSFTLTNNGTIESFPTITLTGAFTNISITHPRGNITTSQSASSGDVVVWNARDRTITKNGADISGTLSSADIWPIVAVGANGYNIKVGTGSPSFSVANQSAWV